MKKGITIKDLAAKLNMSVSTVSKALNDHPFISSFTKTRVLELAKKWNYVRNESARHFKQSKSYTIGFIIPDLLDQFYVLAINGVEKMAIANNYQVVVAQSYEDGEKEEQIIKNLMSSRIDGVIIAISKNSKISEQFHLLKQTGIPVVFLSRSLNNPYFDSASTDNEQGAKLAIDFLFKKKHKRIAHLMGPRSLKISHLRLEAYQKALAHHSVSFDESLVREVDFTHKTTQSSMDELIALSDPPTAIFVFKSYVGLDVLNHFKKAYPEKLLHTDIVGFGNLSLIDYLDQKPTASLDENSYEMGIQAAELLFKRIQNPEGDPLPVSNIKIPCKLVVH